MYIRCQKLENRSGSQVRDIFSKIRLPIFYCSTMTSSLTVMKNKSYMFRVPNRITSVAVLSNGSVSWTEEDEEACGGSGNTNSRNFAEELLFFHGIIAVGTQVAKFFLLHLFHSIIFIFKFRVDTFIS